MTTEELATLLDQLRAQKVRRFKSDDLEVEFDVSAFDLATPTVLEKPSVPIGAEAGNPTEDELLFWSTTMPEIKATPPKE
jgi:hypothetical protein